MQVDHIAILVRDLEAASTSLPQSCTLHTPEEHPTEGTREQYVTFGGANVPALLLMQAVAEGPYTRALEKRGPGLHHIGCVCPSFETELLSNQLFRFLLHPISLGTMKSGTVWLCRPGVPFLVELVENSQQSTIKNENATLILPRNTQLPQFARNLASNLTIETGSGPETEIMAGGVELWIDPTEG
jgi:Glyoxalase/Bleomycin resistance protein/Dioxygenase superfamily